MCMRIPHIYMHTCVPTYTHPPLRAMRRSVQYNAVKIRLTETVFVGVPVTVGTGVLVTGGVFEAEGVLVPGGDTVTVGETDTVGVGVLDRVGVRELVFAAVCVLVLEALAVALPLTEAEGDADREPELVPVEGGDVAAAVFDAEDEGDDVPLGELLSVFVRGAVGERVTVRVLVICEE